MSGFYGASAAFWWCFNCAFLIGRDFAAEGGREPPDVGCDGDGLWKTR